MTKTVRATLLGLALLTLAGCSTKNYGRQGEVTDVEAQLYTCRDIALEKARTRGFLARVEDESRFDGRSVLSFLGDLGIGNVTERSYAIESGLSRLSQLEEVRLMRNCPSQFDEAQSSSAAPGLGTSTHPVQSSPVLAQTAVAAPSPTLSAQQPVTTAVAAPSTPVAPAVVVHDVGVPVTGTPAAGTPAAGTPAAGSPAAAPAAASATPTVTWVFGPNSHTTVRSTTQQPMRPSLQAGINTAAPAPTPTAAPASPVVSAPVSVTPAATPPASAKPSSSVPRATMQTAVIAPAPVMAPSPNAAVECGKGTLMVALLGGGWACEREEWVRGLPPPAPARKPRR